MDYYTSGLCGHPRVKKQNKKKIATMTNVRKYYVFRKMH